MPTNFRNMSVGFIDSNPATDAFQKGQILHQQEMARELAAEGQMLQNVETRAGAPSRLRTLDANARTAGATADVATRTVDSRVSQAGSAASLAGTQADVARQTAPYTIDNAYQGNRVARVNADVTQTTAPLTVQNAQNAARTNEANADVAVQTAPVRVEQARTGLRQANATALNTEMQGFFKSLDLLNAGQTDAAIEAAGQTGQTIPQEVIDNAEVRAAVTRAAKYAQETYPNRPRDQQMFMQGFLKDMADRRANGEPIDDPRTPYQVQGAPQPPELAAGTKTTQPAEIATAEWLVANGVAPNAQAAWEMVRQARANPQQMYAQVFNNALRANFGDQAKAKKTADEFMATIGVQIGGGAPAAPAPAAAAPARPAPAPAPAQPAPARPATPAPQASVTPAGQGTRAAPYQAQTQAHIEWFKTQAPPGAIIVVNGKPFTK